MDKEHAAPTELDSSLVTMGYKHRAPTELNLSYFEVT